MLRTVASLTLAGLSFAVQCRAQTPSFRLPDNITVETNVTYARVGQRGLHLDLFLPRKGAGPFPAIVYVFGGGWGGGKRSQFWRQAAYMATKGFVGATIEYRLSEVAKYPAALYDCKAAVRWLRANASKYRIDGRRIGAAGGSAGGYLVMMLGTTAGMPGFDGEEGDTGVSASVQAVGAFNPVLDLVFYGKRSFSKNNPEGTLKNDVRLFLGGRYSDNPELWRMASPLTHISSHSAPTIILQGTADQVVPYRQAVQAVHLLRKDGVTAELFTARGGKHGFFNRPPWFRLTLKQIERFFSRILIR